MSTAPNLPHVASLDPARDRIDALLAEVAALAQAETVPTSFFAGLLERATHALAAPGGAVWIREDSEWRTTATVGPLTTRDENGWSAHLPLIRHASESLVPVVVPPAAQSRESNGLSNPTAHLLLLGPVQLHDEAVAVIEIAQRADSAAPARAGYLRFLGALCGLTADYLRRRQTDAAAQRERLWARFEQFARRIHASLDLNETAYAIANDGRTLVGCDRTAVLVRHGQRCRLQAISGIDLFDRRSNVVRALESLSAAVLASGDPLWHDGTPQPLPVQIQQPLTEYLDLSQARTLAVIPLATRASEAGGDPRTIGAMIAETLGQSADGELRTRATAVAEHAALALRNAIDHSAVPGIVRGVFGRSGLLRVRQVSRAAIIAAAIATTAAALVFIPADLKIEARGELQPERRRDIFAPAEGIVERLPFGRAGKVSAGDPLVELRDPKLDLEFARVSGERQTVLQKLAAVRAVRSEQVLHGDSDLDRYRRLTGEEEELKRQLEGLDRQSSILERQQSELLIRSPLDGRVLNWNLDKLLAGRPVPRGALLMTVADLDGPWQLELQIRDEGAGHVLAARRDSAAQLPMSFFQAGQPGVVYKARLDALGHATELDASGRPYVRATVRIDRRGMTQLRPGTTVIAKIDCGRRSLGYVWFHDLIEAVQSHLLF